MLKIIACLACALLVSGDHGSEKEWKVPTSVQSANRYSHQGRINLFLPIPPNQFAPLNLKKSSSLTDPSYKNLLVRMGIREETSPRENCTLYRDVRMGGSVSAAVMEVCGYDQDLQMTGTFTRRGQGYEVVSRENKLYVRRAVSLPLYTGEEIVTESYADVEGSSIGNMNTIQLAVFADYSVFKRYLDRADPSSSNVVKTAKEKLEKYMLYLTNMVNVRFATLTDGEDYKLVVKPVYVGAITRERGELTLSSARFGSHSLVSGKTAVREFQSYLQRTMPNHRFDHAILITGADLVDVNTMISSDPVGFTSDASLCGSETSVSVLEYKGAFLTSVLASHFLARSMGIPIDGTEGADMCGSSLGHIMASEIDPSIHSSSVNFNRFSPCSVAAAKKFLSHISSSNMNCLNGSSAVVKVDLPPLSDEFNAHYLCGDLHGSGWVFVGGLEPTVNICSELICTNPRTGEVRNGDFGARGVDGTVCGTGQKCHLGNCVVDTPYMQKPLDVCPQGESRKMARRGEPECRNIRPMDCYNPEVSARCCFTCPIMSTGVDNCQWGDHSELCQRKTVADCDSPRIARECCELCGNSTSSRSEDTNPSPVEPRCVSSSGIRDCMGKTTCETEWDRENCCSVCNAIIQNHQVGPISPPSPVPTYSPPGSCINEIDTSYCVQVMAYCTERPDIRQMCCATCQGGTFTPPTVPPVFPTCQDSADWCPSMLGYCGQSNIRTTCCKTCSTFVTPTNPPQGCSDISADTCGRYHDAGYCHMPSVRAACCVTCSHHDTGAPVTPPVTQAPTCRDSLSPALCQSYHNSGMCNTVEGKQACCSTCAHHSAMPVPTAAPTYMPPTTCRDQKAQSECKDIHDRGYCNQASYRDICCATCAHHFATPAPTYPPPTPTYRPTVSVCRDLREPTECQNIHARGYCDQPSYRDMCCATCAHHAGTPATPYPTAPPTYWTPTPAAVCIDQKAPSECKNIYNMGYCSQTSYMQICCATCTQYGGTPTPYPPTCVDTSAPSTCQSYCSRGMCSDPYYRQLCCASCAAHTTAYPTPRPTPYPTTPPTYRPPTTCRDQKAPSECKDIHDRGYCNQASNQVICCATCAHHAGTSAPTQPPVCIDQRSATECKMIHDSGYCNIAMYQSLCCATCGPHTVGPVPTQPPVRPPPTACVDRDAAFCQAAASNCCQVDVIAACCATCSSGVRPPIQPPQCSDQRSAAECKYYHDNGYCSMQTYSVLCCATCGPHTVGPVATQPPVSPPCNDQRPAAECKYYHDNGYCSMATYSDLCCATCGPHTVGPVATQPPVRPPPTACVDRDAICCQAAASNCGQADISASCCATCANLYPVPAVCTADRYPTAQCQALRATGYCSDESIKTECCLTCSSRAVTPSPMPTTCEQDVFSEDQCRSWLSRCEMEIPQRYCCASCRNRGSPRPTPPVTGAPPPLCIDRHEDCRELRAEEPNACLSPTFKVTCCATCRASPVYPVPPVTSGTCQDTGSSQVCYELANVRKLCGTDDGKKFCCMTCQTYEMGGYTGP